MNKPFLEYESARIVLITGGLIPGKEVLYPGKQAHAREPGSMEMLPEKPFKQQKTPKLNKRLVAVITGLLKG